MSTRTSLPPDLVVEKLTAKTAPPPMFKVLLLNDDYTPMEFVVHILEKFFGKSSEDAFRVMLQVHHEGKGVCGVYPYDIALVGINWDSVNRFSIHLGIAMNRDQVKEYWRKLNKP